MCRISSRLENVNIKNMDDWDKIKEFQCDAMVKFYAALHDRIKKAVK